LRDLNVGSGETVSLLPLRPEGLTLIVERSIAIDFQLPVVMEASWITLKVHSSLEATGLTAAFAGALAAAGISCTVVAATFHDHIFVPVHQAESAMAVLRALQVGSTNQSV
jgi:uncharacterized protein